MTYDTRNLGRLDFNKEASPLSLVTHWCRIDADAPAVRNYNVQYHSFFELHLCLEGECVIEASENKLSLSKKRYLLLPPGEKHRLLYASEDFKKLVFGFSIEPKEISTALSDGASVVSVRAARKEMTDIVDTLLAEAEEIDRFGSLAIMQSLLRAMAVVLIRDITNMRSEESYIKQSRELTDEIVKFIKENLSAKVGLHETSRWLSISERQLERICVRTIGVSFGELKGRIQHEKARLLLSDTDLPLSVIAFEIGFADEYSMSKFFSRREGLPPAKYRRICKTRDVLK